MAYRFTEKQYQKIVDIVNEYPNFGKQYIIPNGGEGEWSTTYKELIKGIFGSTNTSEKNSLEVQYMLALANPSTRELVYDKFVEKDPEFHFILKDTQDSQGWRYHLVRNGRRAIILYPFSEDDDDNPKFKESEIKKWGFDPELFDRKEV